MSEKTNIILRYFLFIPVALLAYILALLLILFSFKKEGEFIDEMAHLIARLFAPPIISVLAGLYVFPGKRKFIPIILIGGFWLVFLIFLIYKYGIHYTPIN